jgi:tetratricopeptide (TPR) repeat protein
MKNILFIIAAIVLSFASYERNLVWHNELSLWQDSAAKSHKWRAYLNLGTEYSKSGLNDNAVAAYKKALVMAPDCAPVHYSLGIIYHNTGSIDLALQELKLALEYADIYSPKIKNPIITKANAHHKLGLLYYEMGMTETAEKEFRNALKLIPLYSDAYYNLGVIYMDRGLWDRAISELESAVSLSRGSDKLTKTHNLLGTAYTRKGSIELGIRNFQEVLKINPSDIEARENLKAAIHLQQLHKEEGLGK